MQRHERIRPAATAWLAAVALTVLPTAPAWAGSWSGYGRDPQHTAVASGPSQLPQLIRWSTPMDLDPQYAGGGGGDLYTHYGSPAITAHNTVIIPVKTGAEGGFVVTAITASSGNVLWTLPTDYTLPPHNWIPPVGLSLTGADLAVVVPGAGGTVLVRTAPDLRRGQVNRLSFAGMRNYNQDPAAFNAAIQINTPLTVGKDGTIYFGYLSTGAPLPGYPAGIPSGLAMVTQKGTGSFLSSRALSGGDAAVTEVTSNCAPAISRDGGSIYVAVDKGSDFSDGYLCKASARPLGFQAAVYLKDPASGSAATLSDDGTGSPTIGPDGDVYYGVLESNFPSHHARGWLLHFDSGLSTTKIPGSFGWDDSASIVPSRLVPSYQGSFPYLILTKYNNYSDAGIGGDGKNKVAILDPSASETDPINPSVAVMKEVIAVLGPTANADQAGVREWCINSAAVDEANRCAVINSEDGHVYRWSFASNTLSPGLKLAPPTGEAYTPTAIGPDGAVYAINNARLFSCVGPLGASPAAPLNPAQPQTPNSPAPLRNGVYPRSSWILPAFRPPSFGGPWSIGGGLLLLAVALAFWLWGARRRLHPVYVRVEDRR